jgi:antitoxin component of RelBE/YafQ-DinJ toxin-antitoxin module
MTDIIDDFLSRIANHVPDLPFDVRLRVESDLRHTWGGSTIQKTTYVEKGIRGYGKETRAMLVSMGLQQRKPLRQITKDIGVYPSTVFRMLNRKNTSK